MSASEAILVELVRGGYLDVRADGTIWRLKARSRTGRVRDIAPVRADVRAAKGYRAVRVSIDGKTFEAMAHRLVWLVHKGEIPAGFEVNHDDGIRDHNAVSNLSPMTHGENQKHSYDKLGRWRPRGERNGSVKLSAVKAAEILALKGQKSSRAVGLIYGVAHQTVQQIWNGRTWQVSPEHNGMPA